MDHTPATPATDDRPLRILERTPVDERHRQRLFAVVRRAQALSAEGGDDLQSEFGKEHVGLIVNHNQFVRLMRAGAGAGLVELLLDAPEKDALRAARFDLREPDGLVFKLFGWVRVDPMEGDEAGLLSAVTAAYAKAKRPAQSPKKAL